MTNITIKVYEVDTSTTNPTKNLVRTLSIVTDSSKPLNAKRARQIISKSLPEYSNISIIIPHEGGWKASRTKEPNPKCTYHYTWEEVVIFENKV